MTDPLTAASIATLIFTTAVSKLTELLTEDARKQLAQKLQALKQLIGNKFQGKAKATLVQAEQGSKADLETVTRDLHEAMAEDPEFAQQVRALAQEIQQVVNISQTEGQTVQNIFDGGKGYQVINPEATVVQGDGNTIHIH